MYLILNLDERFPEPFRSLDISWRNFVETHPVRIVVDGEFKGDFACTHFDVQ